MARVETIVVGGGVGATAPFTSGRIPFIIDNDPPAISDANARVDDSVNPQRVYIGEADGTVPTGSTVIGGHTFGANVGVAKSCIIGDLNTYANFAAVGADQGAIIVGYNVAMPAGTGPGNHQNNIAIGWGHSWNNNASNANHAIVIGETCTITANASNVRCIGSGNAISFGVSFAIVLGDSNQITGNTGVPIMVGTSHQNAGNQGVAVHIGSACNCSAGVGMFRPIMIGSSLTISGSGATDCVLIGNTMTVSGASAAHSLLLSSQTTVSGTSQGIIRLGNAVNATQTYNNRFGIIHIGIGTLFDPGDGAIVLGHNPATVTAAGRTKTLVLGGTDTDATATGFDIRFTNASGNNVAAGSVAITAPLSTGNAVAGRVNLQTGVPGASGVTLQTARVSAAVQASIVAGQTDFLLFDVDNATLERVTVGAADSGGVGFKLLRIPN